MEERAQSPRFQRLAKLTQEDDWAITWVAYRHVSEVRVCEDKILAHKKCVYDISTRWGSKGMGEHELPIKGQCQFRC